MTTKRKAVNSEVPTYTEVTASTNQQVKDNTQDTAYQAVGDNSASCQCARILHHLRAVGPLTTLEARHKLDVMHPAARVQELREKKYNIETNWAEDITPEGHTHRVGQYILLSNKQLSLLNTQKEG